MKKVIKWVAICGGGLIVLIILALLLIPMFVDVQKYKPVIEEKVAESTGRSFTIGDDLSLSLFPWAGISFSNLHFGNPSGFQEKDFITVKSFEVRVKLLPLISRDIQVKRFILEGARIVLEKNKDGLGNWEGLGGPPGETVPKPSKEKGKLPETGLPIKALAVGEFKVSGSALWIDHAKGERKEISDFSLRLQDVSLDRPVQLALSARLDGKPVSLKGQVGPVGKDPGKGTIPLDLAFKIFEQVDMNLKGSLTDPATRQQFDLTLQVSPFSPRKLMAALDQPFPVKTTDQKALDLVAIKARLKGDPKDISISEGVMELDQSKLNFSLRAREFTKPDVAFEISLDQIDLDRYIPPQEEKKTEEEKEETGTAQPVKKIDYTPLRKLALDGAIRIGKLKVKDVKINDIHLKVVGKNGRFSLDPLSLKLYQGNILARGAMDVRKNIPKSNMTLDMKGIQAGPLLRDFMKKDIIEGSVESKVAISMTGDDAERIKKAPQEEKAELYYGENTPPTKR